MEKAPILDTVGGQVSLSQLFKKLAEVVREARDDMKALARLRAIANDDIGKAQWSATAERFSKVAVIIDQLRHSRVKTGVGYGD